MYFSKNCLVTVIPPQISLMSALLVPPGALYFARCQVLVSLSVRLHLFYAWGAGPLSAWGVGLLQLCCPCMINLGRCQIQPVLLVLFKSN